MGTPPDSPKPEGVPPETPGTETAGATNVRGGTPNPEHPARSHPDAMHKPAETDTHMTTRPALFLGLLFLGLIVAANYATTTYGMIPVGFGLVATAGTYLAGLTFVVRDSLQDTAARPFVMATIVAGAALSFPLAWYFADPAHLPPGVTIGSVVLASGLAFLVSESADFAVYSPLREGGYVRAAIASNVVGAVVDTFLFLWVAGFAVTGPTVGGQLFAKVTVTMVAVGVVFTIRRMRGGDRSSSISSTPAVTP